MPGKQDDPNDIEARRERVSWIRLVHLTWRISLADEERNPLWHLFDELDRTPATHPIFDIIYHATEMEAAIQKFIEKFELDADHVATLRDIIQRTIKQH